MGEGLVRPDCVCADPSARYDQELSLNIAKATSGGHRIPKKTGGLNTPYGSLRKGDLLQYTKQNGDMGLGFAIGFSQSDSVGLYAFAAFVHPCASLPHGQWGRQTQIVELVDAGAIVGATPFFEIDHRISPLLHAT